MAKNVLFCFSFVFLINEKGKPKNLRTPLTAVVLEKALFGFIEEEKVRRSSISES